MYFVLVGVWSRRRSPRRHVGCSNLNFSRGLPTDLQFLTTNCSHPLLVNEHANQITPMLHSQADRSTVELTGTIYRFIPERVFKSLSSLLIPSEFLLNDSDFVMECYST